MKNLVTTKWLGGMTFESDNPSGHTIKIDVDAENGGENSGLRPKALMLSSLAGCSGLDVASLMKKMKLETKQAFKFSQLRKIILKAIQNDNGDIEQ